LDYANEAFGFANKQQNPHLPEIYAQVERLMTERELFRQGQNVKNLMHASDDHEKDASVLQITF
jgi:hypothetical protein